MNRLVISPTPYSSPLCARRLALHTNRKQWVPPKYYDTSLEERAKELGCAPEQLCKTMVMENKAFVEVC